MNHQGSDEEREKREIEERLSRIGRILLVLSGKGGVGKSTVAANIAAGLAREGLEVGLLDVDIHGPSIPRMMGLDDSHVITHDGAMLPVEFTPNLKVMSIGFLLQGSSDAVIWRGPMKYGVIRQFVGNVEWGDLDWLIVDSPPGTGDEPLSIAQMTAGKASAVIVTTPQKVSVDDVRKSIDFCRKVEVPIAGIVENMSGFVCPHCGGTVDVFETGGGKRLAEESGVPFLGAVPLDPGVVKFCDGGRPCVIGGSNSAAGKAFGTIIENLKSHTFTKETKQ